MSHGPLEPSEPYPPQWPYPPQQAPQQVYPPQQAPQQVYPPQQQVGTEPWQLHAPGTAGSGSAQAPGGSDVGVAPARRRRRTGLAIGAGVAAVAVMSGGTFVGYQLLSGTGGGLPETHLPAATAGLAVLDLNPGLAQKVDALRIASKFPGSGFSESEDPRKSLWERVTKGTAGAPTWNEVQPWIGTQAAAAVVPSTADPAKPAAVIALEVSDEAAARASLAKLPDVGVAVGDGWAYVARNAAEANAVLAGARSTPLSGDATFRGDLAKVGERGIALLWGDGSKLSRFSESLAAGALSGSPLAEADPAALRTGAHGTAVLRFTGTSLEVVGAFSGLKPKPAVTGTSGIERLPAGTLAALGVAGLGKQMSQSWEQLRTAGGLEQVSTLEEGTGLHFPADLVTLLGDSTAIALGAPAADGVPSLALKVHTTPAHKAPLTRLLKSFESETGSIARRTTSDGYVLATTKGLAATIAAGSGLDRSERFTKAVPDAAKADLVAYADIAALIKAYGTDLPPDDRKQLDPLDAAGLSVHSGDGRLDVRLRITTR